MHRTVIEILEDNILQNGFYSKRFGLPNKIKYKDLDKEDLVLKTDTLQTSALVRSYEFLGSEESKKYEEGSEEYVMAMFDIDEEYHINTLGKLLFALQEQYDDTGYFRKVTLRELGEYTNGLFEYLINAYDVLVHSNHYSNKFLLTLGRSLLMDSHIMRMNLKPVYLY